MTIKNPDPARAELRDVKAWGRKAREATERRDRAIVAATEKGASLRVVATHAGLTHTAIAKIVARDTAG